MSPQGGEHTSLRSPPRGGKRPSKPRQGAFSHPRRGVLRPPSQKRHFVSVFARLTPQGAAAPRQSRFPLLVCLQRKKISVDLKAVPMAKTRKMSFS